MTQTIMSNKKNLLELAGGVAALIGLAALLSFAFAPKAHAISEGYRKQLEREHKTQTQDATGTAAPAAYKPGHLTPIHVKKYGVDFKRSADGFAYLDGSACAVEEQAAQAIVYQCGIHLVTVRKNGHVDLMKNGQFVGHMK